MQGSRHRRIVPVGACLLGPTLVTVVEWQSGHPQLGSQVVHVPFGLATRCAPGRSDDTTSSPSLERADAHADLPGGFPAGHVLRISHESKDDTPLKDLASPERDERVRLC